jgi:hypothetical protein
MAFGALNLIDVTSIVCVRFGLGDESVSAAVLTHPLISPNHTPTLAMWALDLIEAVRIVLIDLLLCND